MQDALSTSFIDARTVGIETWPIHGLLTWEGKVVEVGKEIFIAELTSLMNSRRPACSEPTFASTRWILATTLLLRRSLLHDSTQGSDWG